jgi:hypothetical protein
MRFAPLGPLCNKICHSRHIYLSHTSIRVATVSNPFQLFVFSIGDTRKTEHTFLEEVLGVLDLYQEIMFHRNHLGYRIEIQLFDT